MYGGRTPSEKAIMPSKSTREANKSLESILSIITIYETVLVHGIGQTNFHFYNFNFYFSKNKLPFSQKLQLPFFKKTNFHFYNFNFHFSKKQTSIFQKTNFHFSKNKHPFLQLQLPFFKKQTSIFQKTNFHFVKFCYFKSG